MADFNGVLISSLTELGFPESNVRESVRLCNGDAASALEFLIAKKEEEDEAASGDDSASDEFTYSAVPVMDAQSADDAPAVAASSSSSSTVGSRPAVGYSQSTLYSAPAPAPAAPNGGAIIYSKIPDLSKVVYEELPPNELLTGGGGGGGNGGGNGNGVPQRRSLARQESLMKLYEVAQQKATNQKAGSELAAQLRSKLYSKDGKRLAPASAPKKIPTPTTARAAAIEAAQSGALSLASPMHVIHFAMLSETRGLPTSVNVFTDGKKYAKSFLGSQAAAWVQAHVANADAAKSEEICKKLARGRFILQIDYKAELRPFSMLDVYRLNPKSKLLQPMPKPGAPSAAAAASSSVPLPGKPKTRRKKERSRIALTSALSVASMLPAKPASQSQSASASASAAAAAAAVAATSATVAAAAAELPVSEEMAPFMAFDWYHQRISKTVAEQRVGVVPGNFLLRDSSQAGCLCITYVSAKRGVSHVLVEKVNDRWTMKGAPMSWPSVPELLLAYRKVYSIVVPRPNRPALARHAGLKGITN